jgi:tetratricopeptide (TPR) repeat protein
VLSTFVSDVLRRFTVAPYHPASINPLPKGKSPPYILRLMKFGPVLRAFGLSAALFVNVAAQSGSPDDLYLQAYESIQAAEQLTQTGQNDRARDRYAEAEGTLKKLQSAYPNYNKRAVEFRLEHVTERMKGLPAPKPPAAKPEVITLPGLMDDSKKLLEHIKALQAENATLSAKLQEALAPKPASVDPTEYAKAQQRIQQLEKEKELLRVRADQAQAKQPQAADQAVLDQVRGELTATKQQVVENIASVAALTQERNQLQKEKTDLESKLAAANPVKPQNGNSNLKDLEKERDALLKRLNDANKELYDVKARGQAAQFETLTNQLGNLRARLEVYEARKVPFTKEEMALLDKNVPLVTKVDPKAGKAAPRELPVGAGPIVLEAERLFAQKRHAEAEEKYKQVLQMDEKNAMSLANLAAIQLEMQKLADADANLKKAVEIAPQDPYILSLVGMIRFQEGKYDEALDALGRSAQIDPRNPETQNYLGITLSQQGQREAAETALRKAITLNPNYAGAHHNLAVIYATQRPPFLELARFHYNKALALGQPANPDLEKQIK